jgi:predicted MFS family arabinose efflux permease
MIAMDLASTGSTLSYGHDRHAAAPRGAWTAVGAIGVGAFALVTTEFLPVGLLARMAADLGVSEGRAGMMVTIPGVVAAIAAVLTIGLAGNTDRRRVMVFLLGMLALSNLIVAVAPNFETLLAGRVLLGIAVGGFWTVGGSLGPRLVPGRDMGRATSLILAGVSLGTVAGVPAGAWIGNLLGWRLAFAGAAVVALLVLVAVAALLPRLPATGSGRLRELPRAASSPRVRIGLWGASLLFIGQFAAYTYIAPFLLQRTQVDAGTVTVLLLGFGVAGLLGNALAGWAVGRNLLRALIATALVLFIAMVLMVLVGDSKPWAVAMVLVWGVGFGMLPVAVQTWIFSAAPDRLEAVQALFVSIAQAAIGIGALAGGLAADHFGVPSAMVLGASAVFTAAVLFSWKGRPGALPAR